MIVTREIPPGSGRYRAVQVPDRNRHPRAAPGFQCAICGMPIGKTRTHYVLRDGRVICVRCLSKHDLHDDCETQGTRAGIAAHLGLWP